MTDLNVYGKMMHYCAPRLFGIALLNVSLGCDGSETPSSIDDQAAVNDETSPTVEGDSLSTTDVDPSAPLDSGPADTERAGVDDATDAPDDAAMPRAEPAGDPAAEPEDERSDSPGDTPVDERTEPAPSEGQDPEQEPGMPMLPMGPADPTAAVACSLVDTFAVAVTSTIGLSEAGQVLLDPSASNGYLITLPASGEGYVTLQVPDWMAVIAGFVDQGTSLEILDPNFDTQEVLPVSWNGACSDVGMTDQRLLYHAWGSFAVRLIGEPNADVHVSFIKVQ